MNIKAALGGSSSRRASPERGSDDPALPGRAPRRTGSFGKGLGTALANSMTRATEAVGAGKKNSSSATPTPTPGTPGGTPLTSSKEFPFPAPAAPGTAGPDPQHLSNFSLRLSELVNQALAPTAAGAAPPSSSSGMASVAKHASGRSSVPNLNQIVYEGKRLPNRAKIVEFAHLVVSELRYANGVDPYLLRAVSRAALKALTLFANRVDSLLVPVAKDPSSLIMPTTAKEGAHISAALEFNLGLATITWIVEDSLERCIEGDERIGDNGMPAFVSEILTPVRKRMETTILHVIQPVLAGTKASLTGSLLKAVRQPFLAGASPAVTPSASHDGTLPPLSPLATPGSALASPKGPVDGAAPATNWIKELQGRLDGSRKLLVPRIEARTSQDGEGWFISVVVHLIWKGLFILSTRPVEPTAACASATTKHGMASFLAPSSHQAIADANKRSPSPGQLSAALKSVASVGTGRGRTATATPGGVTPAAAASGRATPAADGTLSPPTAAGGVPHFKPLLFSPNLKASTSQLSDLQAFQKMSLRFCRGFVSDKALAAVAAELSRADIAAEEQQEEEPQEVEDEEDELARQALAEALEAINSTMVVVQAMDLNPAGVRLALERVGGAAHRTVSGSSSHSAAAGDARLAPTAAPATPLGIKPLEPTQLRALKAIPPLLLLHIAYCRLPSTVKAPWTGTITSSSSAYLSHPPALFGISWQEYERSIAGFVGGTSWAQAAVPRWQKEVEALWSEYAALRQELLDAKRNGKATSKTAVPAVATAVAAREGPHHDEKGAGLLDAAGIDDFGIDDFGTTPTPSRLAAAAAAAEQQRRSNEEVAPLSRPATRSDDGRSGLGPTAAGSGSSAASASSRQSSRVHSPAQSPPLGAVDLEGAHHEDDVEDMEGSIGALSLGSASQQSASVSANATATAAKQPTKRFWKSNSGSSETNGAAVAPPAATRTNSSTGGRGFHLPSLSRPTFGSRTSSPAGSVRGGSAAAAGGAGNAAGSTSRSRSSKREDGTAGAAGVYPSSAAHATSSSSLSGAPVNGATGSSATPQGNVTAATSTAEDVELSELARCQEAVAFFAKILDWAAWSAGLEGSVCHLVPAALDGDEQEGRSSSSSSAAAAGGGQ